MAAAVESFAVWLGLKLQDLNTDETVFGSYITAILEGDETTEEKVEGLDGILAEITPNDTSTLSKEILEMWEKYNPGDDVSEQVIQDQLDEKLVRLMESQSLATTVQRSYTAEEKKIREAILAQYSQMSGSEGEEDDGENSGDGLEKNTNALQVAMAVKEKREQAKLDSQKKKDKDKEDREKQKQLKEERKEKRKTQKGERRR